MFSAPFLSFNPKGLFQCPLVKAGALRVIYSYWLDDFYIYRVQAFFACFLIVLHVIIFTDFVDETC